MRTYCLHWLEWCSVDIDATAVRSFGNRLENLRLRGSWESCRGWRLLRRQGQGGLLKRRNITQAALTFFSYSVRKQMSVILNYKVHNSNPLHFLGRCSLNMMFADSWAQALYAPYLQLNTYTRWAFNMPIPLCLDSLYLIKLLSVSAIQD